MNPRMLLLVAPLAVAALLTACGRSGPAAPGGTTTTGASTETSPTTTSTPSPPLTTPSVDDLAFTVDGVGPYQLGVTLNSLLEVGLLDAVETGAQTCPANTSARGTDEYTDIHVSFRPDGLLYLVTNRSPAIETPSGAALGNTLAELNAIYASATHEELGDGFYAALLVRAGSGGRGILFDLGSDNKVFAMSAGDANYLHDSYQNGTDFC